MLIYSTDIRESIEPQSISCCVSNFIVPSDSLRTATTQEDIISINIKHSENFCLILSQLFLTVFLNFFNQINHTFFLYAIYMSIFDVISIFKALRKCYFGCNYFVYWFMVKFNFEFKTIYDVDKYENFKTYIVKIFNRYKRLIKTYLPSF